MRYVIKRIYFLIVEYFFSGYFLRLTLRHFNIFLLLLRSLIGEQGGKVNGGGGKLGEN